MKRFYKIAIIVSILALVLCITGCKKQEFTVSFESVGGTAVEAVKVEEESTVSEPTSPTKVGYTFEGWYLGDAKWSFAENTVTSDITLTAKWTPIPYSVAFSLGGGTANGELPKEFTVESESISVPNPTREGYTFAGWLGEGETEPVRDLVIGKGSVGNRSYTAVWTVVHYDININLGGGTSGDTYPTDYTVEDGIITIAAPTREGYTFAGWLGEGETEPVRNLVISKGSVGNRSYTAVWTVVHYDININLGGGTPGDTYPTDYTVEDGIITIAAPTRDGYTFEGWTFDGAGEPVMNLTIAAGSIGEKTYTATWAVVEYTITVNLGGGVAGGTYPTDYTIENGNIVIANPTKAGYEFDGWSVDGGKPIKDLIIEAGSFGNKTLDAVWTVVPYQITIHLGGGTAGGIYPSEYTVESGVISIADPTRAGYTFAGWDYEGATDPVKNLSFSATELGDKTFTAVWITIRYNITINLQGGEPGGVYPPDYTVEDGIISIQNPTKPGYEFGGWEIDGEGEPVKDLKLDSSEMQDKTLKAIWVVIEFKIEITLGGGVAGAIYPTTYTIEDGTIVLAEPTKTHYEFAGWLIDGVICDGIPVGTLKDLTLTAVWTPVKYGIVYHNCDGIGENVTEYTVEDGITLKTPTRAGYMFAGWFANVALTEAVTEITVGTYGELDLYAAWTAIVYDITYDLDNGTLEGENPATYTVEDAVSLIAPTREGYTFVGWQFGESTVNSIPVGTMGDLTIKAIWKLKEYNITYETNGGTNDGANPDVFNVETELTFIDPVKTGYDFAGWFADEKLTVPVSGIEKGTDHDITVFAKWTPTVYNITVDLQNGTLAEGETIPETYTVEDGEILLPIPTREHYVFVGWLVNGGEKDKIPVDFWGDVTVEAVWKLRDYKITYVLGGGTNNAENPESYTVQDFVRFKAPTREGYEFDGWYSDAELTVAIYDLGKLGTGGDVIVYAKWTPITYTITYVLYDGTNATSNPVSFTVEDLPLRLGEASKYDLFFDAWYTEASFENAIVSLTEAGNITLYARFVPATEGINYTVSEDRTYYIVTGYEGSDTKVIIASTHEGLPVKVIAAYAFQNASNVTEIVIPTSVETIELNALGGCTALEKLTVPFIGGNATDYYSFGYIFGANNYSNNASYVPSTLKTVIISANGLKSYAFYNCKHIEYVEVRAPLTEIPEYSFYNCTAMKGFEIPETVTFIGQNAFYYWSGFLYIPESVERVQSFAFQKAYDLVVYFEHESFPETFDSNALWDLNYYYFNATTEIGTTEDGIAWLLLRDGTVVITGYTGENADLVIPERINGHTVSAIGPHAFDSNDVIKSVVIPNTVKTIGEAAFLYCHGLTEVYIPASVEYVGPNAFWSCLNIKKVEVCAKHIDYHAFGALSKLETLIIGDGVEVIGDGAFQQAYSLTEIVVPNSVQSIGKGAFEYANNLKKITLPFVGASRDAEGYKAVFGYIFGYRESSYSGYVEQYYGINDQNSYRTFYYHIPTSIEEVAVTDCTGIASGAFKNCSSLKKVSINGSMDTLPKLFAGCSSIEEIKLTGSIRKLDDSAFYELRKLHSITLAGVEEIGERVFSYCTSLESIDLSGVKKIGAYAFAECASLASVTFGDVLEEIGEHAFDRNNAMKELKLPDSVKTIGAYAFYVSGLVTVDLGNGVETIGEQAFYCSYSLTEAYIPETVTYIGAYAFRGCDNVILYLKHDAELSGWGNEWSSGVRGVVWGYTGIRGDTEDGFSWILDKDGNVTITGYTGDATEVVIPSTIEGYPVKTVGSKVFYSKNGSVTKVTVPEGITHIGDYAFAYNHSNMEILLPNTLTHVGAYAFNQCYTLTTLPSSLEEIGEYAFGHCYGLTEITLSDRVKSIGLGAFNGCSELTKITVPFIGATADGTENRFFAYIFGATSMNDSGSYVPDTLKTVVVGASVVPNHAFYNLQSLTDVIFTKQVESIGNYAFYYCTSLENLTVPSGVKTIGEYAFYYVPIKSFDFSAVTSIGSYAFCNTALESLTLPETLETIGSYAFASASITGKITVPASVTSFGSNAFQHTKITEAVVLCELDMLPYGVFMECVYLEKVQLPESVTSLGGGAFSQCTSLRSFDFTGITAIGESAFSSCTSLNKIELNDAITVGTYAFSNCTGLVEVYLGDNVCSIGNQAFYYCSSIVKLRIGKAVSSIGSNAFRYCTKLYDICNDSSLTLIKGNSNYGYVAYYAKNIYSSASGESCIRTEGAFMLMNDGSEITLLMYVGQGGDAVVPENVLHIASSAFANRADITSVKLPEGLKTIGEKAFENCTGIKELYIPAGVTQMGKSAFAGCSSLEKITLPFAGIDISYGISDDNHVGYLFGATHYDDSSHLHAPESLKTIVILGGEILPQYAFNRFYYVENIILPDTVTKVGSCVFLTCSALKSVEFKGEILTVNGQQQFGTDVFAYCESLVSVKLPAGMTSIPTSTFYKCTSLESIDFPEGIQMIGKQAFDECKALKEISLPDGLLSIGMYAFRNCLLLTEVTIPNTVTEIGQGAFQSCSSMQSITVPFIGQNANYNLYFGYIFGAGSYSVNRNYVPALLERVVVTGGTTVPYRAFYNCSGIKYITLPEGITTIVGEAFYGCSGLVEFEIPNGVTNIYSQTFDGCTALKKMIIPDSVIAIEQWAFDGCTGMKLLYVPGTVQKISSAAFCSIGNGLVVCVGASEKPAGWHDNWLSDFYGYATVIWNAQKQTYSFESNGGTACPSVTDYALVDFPIPAKQGYHFGGWFDNPDFEGEAILGGVYNNPEKTVLYARWLTDEQYAEWADGSSMIRAYLLALGENQSSQSSTTWCQYTAEKDMTLNIYFNDGATRVNSKKLYIYDEEGKLLFSYEPVNVYYVNVQLDVVAGQKLYIKTLAGSYADPYYRPCTISVSEYVETEY